MSSVVFSVLQPRAETNQRNINDTFSVNFFKNLLTLDIMYGADVGPGGYRRLANLVELIPGVELGDPADCAHRLLLVDQECSLKRGFIFVAVSGIIYYVLL